jgi:N-acetylglucosaminyldiphosphoundecaprenol N-acetyl-beta-D-mannosaminyltransferase
MTGCWPGGKEQILSRRPSPLEPPAAPEIAHPSPVRLADGTGVTRADPPPQSTASTTLPEPVEVLGLPVRPLTTGELVELLVNRARAGLRTTVSYANAHTETLAAKNENFRAALCGCDLLYADGASVVWASRWSRRRLPERMTAADYFPLFARRCADSGVSLYLLGGRPGVAKAAASRLRGEIPALKIVGTHDGYFGDAESEGIVGEINTSSPQVLIVGLSSPRQELWMLRHAEALRAPILWCVGALMDYWAGIERRAPRWLCRLGGEWLFRLWEDPTGKWRRYVIGNPTFVWHVLRWVHGKARPAEDHRDSGVLRI